MSVTVPVFNWYEDRESLEALLAELWPEEFSKALGWGWT